MQKKSVRWGFILSRKYIIVMFLMIALIPPVLATNHPEFRPGIDTLLWEDNINRYTDVPSMEGAVGDANYGLRTYPGDRVGDNQFEIVSGRTGNAVRAIVNDSFPNPPGQTGVAWRTPWSFNQGTYPLPALSGNTATFVYDAWFRLSPAGTLFSDNGPKWFQMHPANAGARTQIQAHNWGTPSATEWGVNPNSRGILAAAPTGGGRLRPNDVNDGVWHHWTVQYRSNTIDNWPSPGSRDGFVQLWIDGIKVIDLSAAACGITPSGGNKEWCSIGEVDAIEDYQILRFSWPGVSFYDPARQVYVDWDDIRWWEQNITDTTPPTRSSGSPTGTLTSGTTQTTISLTTNEAATCKYGTTANTAYSSIANTFTTTGGTSHSRLITGLSNGNNFNYYVRCNDSSNNFNTNDFTISFGVSMPAVCGDNICNGAETCSTCSADCGVCSSGLVASYNFDEGTGSSLTDKSGNGNTGSVTGAIWTTGRFGSGLSFDGVNDYVSVSDSSSLDITGNKMSVSAWIYATALAGNDFIVSKYAGGPNDWFFDVNTGRLEWRIAGTDHNEPGFSISTNTWYHVAGTYDGSNVRLYVNAIEVYSASETDSLVTNDIPLSIGAHTPGSLFWTGSIDDVRIYDRALSQAEIQVDMNTPVGAASQITFTYDWSEWDNETTNFSLYTSTQLQDIGDVKFVNKFGAINFLERLNLSKLIYDLRNRIRVFSHKIWVNSSLIPEFNKSAQLTFRDVGFTNPIIKVDGVDCPATVCQDITFNEATGDYVFNVTAFSVFEVVEQCEDGIQNYDETGIDCGGSCGECFLNSNWIWVVGIVVVGLVVWGIWRGKKRK